MGATVNGQAAELRQIRESLGMSRADFARAIDRSEKTVGLAEIGSQRLGPKAWGKIQALMKQVKARRTGAAEAVAAESATQGVDLERVAEIATGEEFPARVTALADLLRVDRRRAWLVLMREEMAKSAE